MNPETKIISHVPLDSPVDEPVTLEFALTSATSQKVGLAALAWEQCRADETLDDALPWESLPESERAFLHQAAVTAIRENTDWNGNAFLVAVHKIYHQ